MTSTTRRLIELPDGRSLDVTTGGPDISEALLLIQGTPSARLRFNRPSTPPRTAASAS